MNINYQKVLDETLASLEGKPKLLLHACCAICSSYVLDYLCKYFQITVLYYNPNIYPESEYQKRLLTEKKLLHYLPSHIDLLEIPYQPEEFYEIAKGLENEKEGGARCYKCYYLRLEKTAQIAKEQGFDYFCTTLSISPYKDAQKLNKIGKILETKYQIKYLYSDFKKKDGFKKSNELAYKYQLYRQNYCGCEYSMAQVLSVK